MADAADEAQAAQAELNERALEAHRQARIAESKRPRNPLDELHCRDCGAEIEARRRELLPMTNRCASCAHGYEEALRHAR